MVTSKASESDGSHYVCPNSGHNEIPLISMGLLEGMKSSCKDQEQVNDQLTASVDRESLTDEGPAYQHPGNVWKPGSFSLPPRFLLPPQAENERKSVNIAKK